MKIQKYEYGAHPTLNMDKRIQPSKKKTLPYKVFNIFIPMHTETVFRPFYGKPIEKTYKAFCELFPLQYIVPMKTG